MDISNRLAELGFQHTKKWDWVRLGNGYADFVHLHREGSSYGGQLNYSISFRIYCGNRILNDDFESLVLNGPNSDSAEAESRIKGSDHLKPDNHNIYHLDTDESTYSVRQN
ncbi:MAG: hypothetical protein ACLFQT_11165 [Thiohalophilus sp.]